MSVEAGIRVAESRALAPGMEVNRFFLRLEKNGRGPGARPEFPGRYAGCENWSGRRVRGHVYGLIVKLGAVAGNRDELIAVLAGSTKEMPGCFGYVVAKDSKDENGIWVTEVWDSEASHDASLLLPAVKEAVAQAKPMVASFEKIAITTPVAGVGFSS